MVIVNNEGNNLFADLRVIFSRWSRWGCSYGKFMQADGIMVNELKGAAGRPDGALHPTIS